MDKPQYYIPGEDMFNYDEIELYRTLQHYHYERALKYQKKTRAAVGKPYQPKLYDIAMWHGNYAALLTKHIKHLEAVNEIPSL